MGNSEDGPGNTGGVPPRGDGGGALPPVVDDLPPLPGTEAMTAPVEQEAVSAPSSSGASGASSDPQPKGAHRGGLLLGLGAVGLISLGFVGWAFKDELLGVLGKGETTVQTGPTKAQRADPWYFRAPSMMQPELQESRALVLPVTMGTELPHDLAKDLNDGVHKHLLASGKFAEVLSREDLYGGLRGTGFVPGGRSDPPSEGLCPKLDLTVAINDDGFLVCGYGSCLGPGATPRGRQPQGTLASHPRWRPSIPVKPYLHVCQDEGGNGEGPAWQKGQCRVQEEVAICRHGEAFLPHNLPYPEWLRRHGGGTNVVAARPQSRLDCDGDGKADFDVCTATSTNCRYLNYDYADLRVRLAKFKAGADRARQVMIVPAPGLPGDVIVGVIRTAGLIYDDPLNDSRARELFPRRICKGAACLSWVGGELGAQYVFAFELNQKGADYVLRSQGTNVQTSKSERHVQTLSSLAQVPPMLNHHVDVLRAKLLGEAAPPSPAMQAPPIVAKQPRNGGEYVHISVRNPQIRGGVSTEALDRAVEGRSESLRSCYTCELDRGPLGQGGVKTRAIIDGQGGVRAVKVIESSYQDRPELSRCLAQQVGALKFPRPYGGEAEASWMLMFSPGVRPPPKKIRPTKISTVLEGAGASSSPSGGGGPVGIGDVQAVAVSGGAGKLKKPKRTKIRVKMKMSLLEIDGGELDAQKVGNRIRRRKRAFQACYERSLKRDPKLRGKVRLEVGVGANGRVTSVERVQNQLNGSVGRCLQSKMRSIRFPKPAGAGDVSFAYDFVFAAE